MNRQELTVEIEILISRGEDILRRVEFTPIEILVKELEEIEREEQEWAERIGKCTEQLADSALAREYSSLQIESLTDRPAHDIPALKTRIDQRFAWLKKLKQQVDGMQESKTAPTADFTSERGL